MCVTLLRFILLLLLGNKVLINLDRFIWVMMISRMIIQLEEMMVVVGKGRAEGLEIEEGVVEAFDGGEGYGMNADIGCGRCAVVEGAKLEEVRLAEPIGSTLLRSSAFRAYPLLMLATTALHIEPILDQSFFPALLVTASRPVPVD